MSIKSSDLSSNCVDFCLTTKKNFCFFVSTYFSNCTNSIIFLSLGVQGVQGLKGTKGELGLSGPDGPPGLQGTYT